jgi:hypothetical protein
MKSSARWLLLFPAVVAALVCSWLLYWLGINLAYAMCPTQLYHPNIVSVFVREHFGNLDYQAAVCGAPWFQAADLALLTIAIWLSFLATGFVGYRLAPSHKRLAAALASFIATSFFVYAFAYSP